MKENPESKVLDVENRYSNFQITSAEAEHYLLALIDEYGAEFVLDRVGQKLRNIVHKWFDEAPKTSEDWQKMKVFEARQNSDSIPEYVAVPMTPDEINARLKVIRLLDKYFKEN